LNILAPATFRQAYGIGAAGAAPASLRTGLSLRLKFPPEKDRLGLAVEADLKPALSICEWLKPEWLNPTMIQPRANVAHRLTERTIRFLFDAHHKWRTERHLTLLPLAREAGA
jgi:hypothetical protein